MRRVSLVVGAALSLAGCAVGPDYQRPKVPVPKHWESADQPAKPDTKIASRWWLGFHDELLNQLIDEALAANLDLQQTEARIRAARAQRTAAIADALPNVAGRSNLSRRQNATTSATASGATGGIGGFGVGSQLINIFQSGFDAQWEIDLFGGIRRSIEAADAALESEQENRRDVMVSLLAEVARNYIDVRANQQLLKVSQGNLLAQKDTLGLIQARAEAGLASGLEVSQQLAQVAATESQLPVYITALKTGIHALSVLLGREPAALSRRLEKQGEVPSHVGGVVVDLPSELLRRRPDIRRAERQLQVGSAQIGIATAELYPKVNLAAFLGLQNTRITDISPLGKSWSAAASLSVPIFNWGKLQANIKGKEAEQEQNLLSYRSTVLNAFREVEDSLVAYREELDRRRALAEAVDASRLAMELASERYLKGLVAFLDVLESQRALFQAENDLVSSEAKVSESLVALYKALGGGWDLAEPNKDGELGLAPDKVERS